MVWQRPENVEYPKVWLKFENQGQSFVVKDLTEEYYDITIGYMTNIFMTESAICKPLRILEDPVSRKQLQDKWLDIIKAKMSIICVTEDELPRVAGIHLTMVRERDTHNNKRTDQSGQYAKFARVVEELKNEGQLFDKFGSDAYIGSLGLFVLPEFRKRGIGTHMLKARLVMCKELSMPGTATVFSTPGAQAAARKAGYEVFAKKTPEDCQYITLEHTLSVMGKKI